MTAGVWWVPIVLVWSALTEFPAFAVDTNQSFAGYTRTHFTTDDGLPASVVDSIQQTPDGFLWLIVNGNQVTRFDGRQFHGFDKPNATALAVGPNGDLWIGTFDGLQQIPFDSLSRSDLSSALSYGDGWNRGDPVRCLRFGPDGTLWVGSDKGLFRFADRRFSLVTSQVGIQAIEIVDSGHLYLSTTSGLIEWDRSSPVPLRDLEAQLGTKREDVFHALEDSHRNIWYCSTEGVTRRSGAEYLKLSPHGPGNGAYRSYEDGEGNIWITGAKGLFRATPAGLESALPGMEVRSVYSDCDGTLWVGTNGDGLYRFKDPAGRLFTTADGLPNDVIQTVLSAHDGSIWTGANCGGLTRFDGSHFRTYSEKDGLLNSCVWSLAEDANHDLWVGTWGGGAFRFHDGRFTQVIAGGNVLSIVAARDGSVWFATQEGLARLKDGQVRIYTTADGLSKNSTLRVFENRAGRILAFNWGGIDRLVGDRFENLSGIPKTLSMPMGEDRSGALFVRLYGQTAAVRIDGERIDFIPEIVHGSGLVATNSGDLWFAAFGAIRRIASADLARPRTHDEPLDDERFGAQDGLRAEASGGAPIIALGGDGAVWVATPRGLARCDAPHLTRKPDPPFVYITEVTIGRETRPAPRELSLQPGTSHVEVGFAAVEITAPEKIRMQYKLDGVDSEWLDVAQDARAIFSNIPAGTHKLRIRACNRFGIWDRAGVAYPIHQLPHFYQTGWFAILLAVGIVSAGWIAFRIRLRQVIARLDSRYEERLKERNRIAGELHDTLLQGVLSVSMQLHLVSDSTADGSQEKNRLGRVRALLDRVIEDARISVQGLRSGDAGQSEDLERALSRVPEEFGGTTGTSFRVLVSGRPRPLRPVMRDEVYRICRESLLNALRHSGARGIEVEISYLGRGLTIVIKDDGRGIDPAILRSGREGHWGLQGMRERAERIGAQLTLRSREGAGTEIDLTLPARIAFSDHAPGSLRRILNAVFRPNGRDPDGSDSSRA